LDLRGAVMKAASRNDRVAYIQQVADNGYSETARQLPGDREPFSINQNAHGDGVFLVTRLASIHQKVMAEQCSASALFS
jgi:hypothetical protein